ncbi:MAG: PAS domain-containing protein [Alphaproteobacteria bacterium]|nr:PAS domain-containing protein [Alphaproteobacteria bacterium]MBV9693457.1 PAS domain-containing protein [Alphaproteobacteria bacterium]
MSPDNVYKSAHALESSLLAGVHATWTKVAAGRLAPRRDEITPAVLKTALPWIWMFDAVDGGADFRFRFAGDRVVQFMGRRYAGEMLSTFAKDPFFQRMRAVLLDCVRSRAPVAAGPMRSLQNGKEYLQLEVVVLPLSEDGAQITTLFGALDIRPIDRVRPKD